MSLATPKTGGEQVPQTRILYLNQHERNEIKRGVNMGNYDYNLIANFNVDIGIERFLSTMRLAE